MYVKLRFQCNYPTDRKLQPIEMQKLEFNKNWKIFGSQQNLYEKSLFEHNPPPNRENIYVNDGAERPWQEMPYKNIPPLFMSQLNPREQQKQQFLFERVQKEEEIKFQNEVVIQLIQLCGINNYMKFLFRV